MSTQHDLQTPTKYRLSGDRAAVVRTNPPCNMNVVEAAAYLCISPRKLRELIACRKVKHARLGKKIIIPRIHLDELLNVA